MSFRGIIAAAFAAGFVLVFCLILLPVPIIPPGGAPGLSGAGTVLWNDRTFEVMLQGFIILAGVVSILLLLVSGDRKEKPL